MLVRKYFPAIDRQLPCPRSPSFAQQKLREQLRNPRRKIAVWDDEWMDRIYLEEKVQYFNSKRQNKAVWLIIRLFCCIVVSNFLFLSLVWRGPYRTKLRYWCALLSILFCETKQIQIQTGWCTNEHFVFTN